MRGTERPLVFSFGPLITRLSFNVFDDLAAITLQFAAVYDNCNYTTGLCQSPGTLRVSSD